MPVELEFKPSDYAQKAENLAKALVHPVEEGDRMRAAIQIAQHLKDPITENLQLKQFFSEESLARQEQVETVAQEMIRQNPWYELTPNFLKIKASNYIDTTLLTIYHLAGSLIEEIRANSSQSIDNKKLTSLIAKQLALQDFILRMQSTTHVGLTKEDVVLKEIVVNGDDLDFIEEIIRSRAQETQEALPHTLRHLHKIQPHIWELLTSNQTFITPDYNYRLIVNCLPGTVHSLLALPQYPDYYHATSYGNYLPFIEAASGTEIAGMSTSFAFLHFVEVDKDGIAYQVEYPLVMIPDEIMQINSPLIKEIIKTDLEFYRNHDLWHNLIPVHADHFILHHPDAPISHGGKLPSYLNFARDMRIYKEEYELAVGMAHADTQEKRGLIDPTKRMQQFKIIEQTLDNIKSLKAELERSHSPKFAIKIADHLATLYVSRTINVYPPTAPEYKALEKKIRSLDLPPITVTKKDLLFLFFTQGLVKINDTNINKNPHKTIKKFSNDQVETYLNQVDLGKSDKQSGVEYLIDTLEEIGVWPMREGGRAINGLAKCRWVTIMMPQRLQLKGYAEKIHGKKTVSFGTPKQEISPYDLLIKQTHAIQENIDDYQIRILAVQLNQRLARDLFRMIFPDETIDDQPILRHLIRSLKDPNVQGEAKRFIALVDKMIASLATHTYEDLTPDESSFIKGYIQTINGVEEKSKIIRIYSEFCKAQHEEMRLIGKTFIQARREQLDGLMSLSS